MKRTVLASQPARSLVNLAPGRRERILGVATLAMAAAATYGLVGPWWPALLLFFVPDLAAMPMLVDARLGVASYNAAHRWIGPLILVGMGSAAALEGVTSVLVAGLLWLGHVGFDRALGYGLKEVRR